MNSTTLVRGATFSCVVLLLSACGFDNASPLHDLGITQSQAILPCPPNHLCFTGGIEGGTYTADGTSEIYITAKDGDAYSLSFPSQTLLFGRGHRVAGIHYLLVGVATANDETIIYSYHDSDSDGRLDDEVATQVLSTTPMKTYLNVVSIMGDTWFARDARCQDLWRGEAVNGFPSSMSLFAKSADHPELLDMSYVKCVSDDSVLLSQHCDFASFRPHLWTRFTRHLVEDTDADGTANTVATLASSIPPTSALIPYDGQTTVHLRSRDPGLVVQVWALDASGVETTLLGSATVDPDGVAAAAVSPALADGQQVAFKTSGASTRTVETVRAAFPQVSHLSVDEVPTNVISSFTVYGANFDPSMTLEALGVGTGDTPVALTFTVASSGEAIVTGGILPSEWAGKTVNVIARGASQPSTVLLRSALVSATP